MKTKSWSIQILFLSFILAACDNQVPSSSNQATEDQDDQDSSDTYVQVLIPGLEIEINQNPVDLAQTPAIDLGSELRSLNVKSYSVVIKNNGTARLDFTSDAAATGDFHVSGDVSSFLLPQSMVNLQIEVDLSALGRKNGKLKIFSNAGDLEISLTMEVLELPPRLRVEETSTGNVIEYSGYFVSVGNARLPQTLSKTFTVKNDGDHALSLSLNMVDALNGDTDPTTNFRLTEPLAATLAPGAEDTFTVEYFAATPLSSYESCANVFTRDASIEITSNDPETPTLQFYVYGNLTGPLNMTPTQMVIVDNVDFATNPNLGDFGTVAQGTTKLKWIYIRNCSDAAINTGSIHWPSGYSLISDPVYVIPGRGSKFIRIDLNTSTPGTYAGDFIHYTTAGTVRVPLTGTVVP